MSEYDLGATLNSGQAFRWFFRDGGWEGVIGTSWVRLTSAEGSICAETAVDHQRWDWLTAYLQTGLDLASVLSQFPPDPPMQQAVTHCRGLRLLRQEPWECLACFILSSTKQIVQIQQIVQTLCARFGEPLPTLAGREPAYAFPTASRLAQIDELELRACKMGFRAPYLKAAATAVATGRLDLNRLSNLNTEHAREQLLEIPGVGRKIADCVLLFAFGFQDAFPVDVWIAKALRELYFRNRRVSPKRLQQFSQTHFGQYAGYAQQYLFHHIRTRPGRLGTP